MGKIGCQLRGKFPRSRVRVALTYLKYKSIVGFLYMFSPTYRFCRHDRLHKRRLSKHHLSLWTESFEDAIRYTRKVLLTLKHFFSLADELGKDCHRCGMEEGGWKSEYKQLCVSRIIR